MGEIPAYGHARMAPGSVVALPLESGQLAYVQYVRPSWCAPLIRVCVGTYDEPLPMARVRELVASPSLFRVQFPIDAVAGRRQRRVVARLPVPAYEAEMPPYRFSAGWPPDYADARVIDTDGTSRLSGREFAARHPEVDLSLLPLWDVPFFGTLSWMIEVQWTPRLAHGASSRLPPRPPLPGEEGGPELPPAAPTATKRRRKPSTSYLASFVDRASGERALEKVLELPEVSVQVVEPEDESGEWLVVAARAGTANSDVEKQIEAIAEELGGSYEGIMVGPFQ